MLPLVCRDKRSFRDRFLLWFYPNRGWSADLHEVPPAPASGERKAVPVPPETPAGGAARANAG